MYNPTMMEKTEGFVIRQVDFSESSKILTLFTHENTEKFPLSPRVPRGYEDRSSLLLTC